MDPPNNNNNSNKQTTTTKKQPTTQNDKNSQPTYYTHDTYTNDSYQPFIPSSEMYSTIPNLKAGGHCFKLIIPDLRDPYRPV